MIEPKEGHYLLFTKLMCCHNAWEGAKTLGVLSAEYGKNMDPFSPEYGKQLIHSHQNMASNWSILTRIWQATDPFSPEYGRQMIPLSPE